jgi:hypothetical protein
MTEKTFKSPNFFEREIDLSGPSDTVPFGTPTGFIGASQRGPAFVPITVSSFEDFRSVFGDTLPGLPAVYGVKQFLENRNSAMFCRVLGAGVNESLIDIAQTEISGTVKNAGFSVLPNGVDGSVRFISALHTVQANEDVGDRSLTDNNSITNEVLSVKRASMVRAGVMLANHVRMLLVPTASAVTETVVNSKLDYSRCLNNNEVVIVLSSSSGSFGSDNALSGVKLFSVSFDPSSTKYIANVLNTDPSKFSDTGHLLYLNFPVESSLAIINSGSSVDSLVDPDLELQPEFCILSGSANTNSLGLEFSDAFGRYDTRFTFAKTSKYVSQPFGNKEFELFHFESIDDGSAGNNKVKITIADLKLSIDENNKYSSFTVQVRDALDNDLNQVVLEEYRNCDLNPESDNYVAKKIGDRRITFNFDSQSISERRLVVSGKYPNKSRFIRVVMDSSVENKKIPDTVLPFGFRGQEHLNLGSILNSDSETLELTAMTSSGSLDAPVSASIESLLRTSVVPPVPMRLKITRGELNTALGVSDIQGTPSKNERTLNSLCWGVKFERTENPLNPNSSLERNKIFDSYSKFIGLRQLDVVVTGSNADLLNNNKFSLSKVALGFESIASLTGSVLSAQDQMKRAIYFRNSVADASDSYKLTDKNDTSVKLISFATLASNANVFNQYSQYMKYTNYIGGGFDGLNILDKDLSKLNDRSTSQEEGGCATSDYATVGLGNVSGVGSENNNINSYKIAVDIMTDPMVVNHNMLFVPDIRDSLMTDHIMSRVKKNGMIMYVMDMPSYDEDVNRLFEDSTKKPDIDRTIQKFQTRFIDNNFTATYYPDVTIEDSNLKKRVKVPSSVAVAGAIGFNDRISFAWFAPAGFNRASLEFVKNVGVRLNVEDRNKLYDARINPIAVFPRQGFVIYGQKTLQISKSALDRVNVRRLMIEVKRSIVSIANSLVFETNNAKTRANFVAQASLVLSGIQAKAGVESFQIVMNETNNTPLDIDQQKLNGKIVVIPTRSIEFISIDFIITPSGVQFV